MFGLKEVKRMKKKLVKTAALSVVLCGSLFCIASDSTKAAGKSGGGTAINLEGQWKVTDYLASWDMIAADDYYEHFLGRSIVIEPNRIIRSFGSWDSSLEDVVSQYRIVEVETVNGGTYGARLEGGWHQKYADQEITVVTFSMPESSQWNASDTFVVTEEGETLCWYQGDIYYMEKYREAVTDMEKEELYGEWKVRRLVSYQDGWRGRNGLFYGTRYKEENGGCFYPESYLGDTVLIREDGMELYDSEGGLLDSLGTDGYTSRMTDKYDYQNGKGIHDELGLTNEEIQVFAGNTHAPDGAVLEEEIVAVSRTEVIMKIYQGWYLLEKEK